MIQYIFSIPDATDPAEITEIFTEAGYGIQMPPSGVMPSSAVAGGRHLVHCVVSGASHAEVETLLMAQRPVWVIMGAIDGLESLNPAYDPDVPEEIDGEPNPAYEPATRAVVHEPLNSSVWNFLPNRLDSEGNATIPQTKLHRFQGLAPFEGR